MRNLEEQITQYAAYHRDRRNIATHFVGVPMIVFGVVLALAQILVGPVHLGWIGILVASVYFLILDRPLGVAMVAYLLVNVIVASVVSAKTSIGGGFGIAAVFFVVGWIIQFIGHRFEGVKPAFTDDIMGLVIAPLFIVTEFFFILGARRELKQYVEDRVGPVLAARDGALIGPVVRSTKGNVGDSV